VGFAGSVPGARITRSQEEARALAYDILSRAEAGADFDALVREHTDDSPPGIYGMSNRGVQPSQGEYPRDGMVPAFGNVGFTLGVGGYGVADFDSRTSPYGYHVIKRLK
jgi:parvulin-like peptidyl-prolyl isomerase